MKKKDPIIFNTTKMEKKQSKLQFSTEYQNQNFFMEENSPLNPYGPNYFFLAYDTKVYNKFIRLRRYVHFSPEDNNRILKANIYYFLGLVTSFLMGISLGIAVKRVLIKRITKINDFVEDHPRVYFGVMGSGLTTLGYSFLNDYYMVNIYYPLMSKYLENAKENGFEDYKIDESYKDNKVSFYIKKYLGMSF